MVLLLLPEERRFHFLSCSLIKSFAYSGKIPVGLKVFFVTHTCARRFTYVGSPVDNRGLYSPRMWDRNYSYTWIQIEGYEDLFLAFVFSILQGSSSGTERELLAESQVPAYLSVGLPPVPCRLA